MRIPKFSYVLLSAMLMSVSCSKDSATDNDPANGPDTENPKTGKSDEDETERAAAKQLYLDYYEASRDASTDVSWTGSVPNCEPGTVPQATKDKILMRLSYFRKAVGLNNEIADNISKSEKAQEAALMMHANGNLSHDPPNDWDCFTQDGALAASKSLLTSTRNAGAIDSYIRDQGSDNYPVGHRRWLLWPRLKEIGVGNTSSYNAVWVIGDPGTRPANTPEFIAWPPQGHLPKQLAYPRWSFSINKADFKDTQVSMITENGDSVDLEIEELTGIYGDNTIVWRPEVNPNILVQDTTYTISLNDVKIDGNSENFTYKVVLFDVTQ